MANITITETAVNEDIAVVVKRKYKCNLPPYGRLGNTERRTKVLGIDMHTILKDLSKGSTYLFWLFIQIRNPRTNTVNYLPKCVKERRQLTKAYKELHDLNVLKRIKQGEYLISPIAYIPDNEQFDDVLRMWKEL